MAPNHKLVKIIKKRIKKLATDFTDKHGLNQFFPGSAGPRKAWQASDLSRQGGTGMKSALSWERVTPVAHKSAFPPLGALISRSAY
jgi:hypothetical protein